MCTSSVVNKHLHLALTNRKLSQHRLERKTVLCEMAFFLLDEAVVKLNGLTKQLRSG